MAEATPDELKREVVRVDFITVEVTGDAEAALRLLQTQALVREASVDGSSPRLYVDRGESATPGILRLLDGAGLGSTTIALSRPSLDDVPEADRALLRESDSPRSCTLGEI